MKRTCKLLIGAKDGKRAIYLDDENGAEIIAYFTRDARHIKKFKFISEIILGGFKNTSIYDKEDINDKCKDVTAMKFFKGQDNDRIYCKEVHSSKGTYIVVAAILYEKKKNREIESGTEEHYQQSSIIQL